METEQLLWMFVGVALLATFAVAWHTTNAQRAEQLAKALAAYKAALAKLKEQPTDASLRQTALETGRIYSGLTRESNAVTLFDEMALKNDLDAAAAGAPASTATTPATLPTSVAERLRTLGELRAQNLISEDEFNERRERILQEI